MKVKVTRKFRDKYTGALYEKGAVLDIAEERYAEIMRAGAFVFKIAQNAVEASESEGNTNPLTEGENVVETRVEVSDDGFEAMTVRELKEYADKTYKLTFASGTKKAEIIEKLRRLECGEK